MRRLFPFLILFLAAEMTQAQQIEDAANGVKYPENLANWRIIASSYRQDNDTQRIILGNHIAIQAVRSATFEHWPKGSILAKLVWKNTQHAQWQSAIVPGKLVHTEIMVKDDNKYKVTGGWGYARWKGSDLQPYGKNADFAQECYSCHTQVIKNDYVFTSAAELPGK